MNNTDLLTLDAEVIITMYHHEFSKKQAVKTGQEWVSQIFDEGELDPLKVFSNIVRLKEVVNSADKAFRDRLDLSNPESVNGVSFKQNNGTQRLNYSDDFVYAELERHLADRQELLKTAFNSKDVIYDSMGADVPKVSCSYTKPSITVTF